VIRPRPWLADATAIARLISRNPSTVRSWIRRGHLRPAGTGSHGQPLYDVEEAEKLAQQRPQPSLDKHP